ncbi:MAG: inositol monophosphatase [Candidatus Thermoplasmatota archaeon]|nr:inositol monophosphatase [Candidatus Thermoplasmatota archaeon]
MRELLVRAAEAAYEALRRLPKDEWHEEVGMGANGSPTALVDRKAEEAVESVLDEADAALNFLSEESEFIDRDSEWTLVVDPVDGSHNALAGIPVYSVSLAICREDMVGARFAVVKDLTNGWTYEAEKDRGAWLNGQRIRVSSYSRERSLFSIYLGANAHEKSFKLAHKCRRLRNLGAASLDMCMVASGAADLYYMNSTARNLELRITDVAASSLIVREAGGEVYDLQGDVLNMPFDPTYRSNLLALGDRKLLEAIL